MAWLQFWLKPNRHDIAIAVLIQFLLSIAVWRLAARLGVSAIITMVAHALAIAHFAPARMGGRDRIA